MGIVLEIVGGVENLLISNSRGDNKVTLAHEISRFFRNEKPLKNYLPSRVKSYTMVKKRVRDPEVLADAPPAQAAGEDSGSDEASQVHHQATQLKFHANCALGC